MKQQKKSKKRRRRKAHGWVKMRVVGSHSSYTYCYFCLAVKGVTPKKGCPGHVLED